ncbi:MAG: RNA-guided endonuclease TnpB family protein [Desulfuromonadales bacterium]
MNCLQAYRYRLRPSGEQRRQMLRLAGSCRFVWNRMLALQKQLLDAGEPVLRYNQAALLLPGWKHELPWLKTDAHSQALQQTLKSLDRALMDAFDKSNPKRFPRFKKKGQRDSFRYPQGCKLDQVNSRIYLPKLGWVRYRNSRVVLGTVKNVTVSRTGDHWFVSIQTERDIGTPIHPAHSAVGIDVGIARFATLSDGSVIEPLNSLKKYERKLASAQRSLARKVKFSNNWHKQKRKIARLHQLIANVRADFLHKSSNAISKNHAVVVLEDLQVKNMSASASGTKEQPGKRVNQKRGLNRSILDQGWSEFRRQLEYKQSWRGGMVLAVPPQNTSRTCPECGHVSTENRKTQAKFLCVQCGHSEHADLVAAKNILAAGHAVAACGEPAHSGHSAKQEPTEGLRHVA